MQKNTQTFGERLKSERERLGFSQAYAAESCGVRREMWGKYERDLVTPGCSVLERFSAYGGDSLYVLVGRREALRLESLVKDDGFSIVLACVSVAEAFTRYEVGTNDPFAKRVGAVVRLAINLNDPPNGASSDSTESTASERWRVLAEGAVLEELLRSSIQQNSSGVASRKT